jgi:Xaa-Pro dipeptidase
MQERVERLKGWMAAQGVDVSIVLKPQDVFYLSGSAPICSGLLIFRQTLPIEVCIWLDGQEVKKDSFCTRVAGYRFPEFSMAFKMAELIQKEISSPRVIGIEKDFMTVRFYDTLATSFPEVEFVSITRTIDEMRAIKTPEEIRSMKKAAAMADAGMQAALKAVKPGITEIEIAGEAEYAMRKAGSEGLAFGTMVASGPRTLLAHPYASSRKIGKRDLVVVDIGAKYRGYSSDLCRTAFTGNPSEEQKKFLSIMLEAQRAVFDAARPDVTTGEVYGAAEKMFAAHGYGKLIPGDIGYGSGLRQSEFFPMVCRSGQDVLQPNMVLAVFQTTAYLSRIGGIRVEDQIVIQERGYHQLSKLPQPIYD